ncbi:protein adenylyltransferase SelO [Alkalicoccus daliensis]|uniref:Protein nucleotidyltransferase YdiU n=1 Tax=Alkalicoccus daliensis TaxID=745820 RepID=A0A1H0GW63_9BACI|nr:YdiU family protein [Alkalicoccus daliensis]SDO11286.1 Uncharacterized conserved protein YdiU, UPF0061 family [Alkalicoccus daliensis]
MAEGKETITTGWKLEHTYTSLPQPFFTNISLNPVRSPGLVIANYSLAEELGLNPEALQSDEGVQILAGNKVPEESIPFAQAYAGHQFGNFTMLGDGRALMIGEQITPKNERRDVQLKGSGRTPYSRGGDGRAALGPMLREYILSEAMHALGVPTNRSLAVVTTGEPVYREKIQKGAVLTRIASSHIRTGTFEYAVRGTSKEDLQKLADYTLERHFPGAVEASNRYLFLLQEVINRQAELITEWQRVGFIHGVMNTDNMALSGETIDYGPCAFMNEYDPATVFSSIDVQGRYAYGNQPYIAGWNLARLAESLIPLLHEDQEKALEMAQKEISNFTPVFEARWLNMMRAKLGLFNEAAEDKTLVDDLLRMMKENKADFTNTFRALASEKIDKTVLAAHPDFKNWQERWIARQDSQEETKAAAIELMQSNNPAVIPRNHRVEEALAAADEGDYSVMHELLEVLSQPYNLEESKAEYCTPPGPANVPYRTYCGT